MERLFLQTLHTGPVNYGMTRPATSPAVPGAPPIGLPFDPRTGFYFPEVGQGDTGTYQCRFQLNSTQGVKEEDYKITVLVMRKYLDRR